MASGDEANNKKVEAFVLRGEELYADCEYDSAIKELTEAIQLDPDHADAYSKRGLSWHAKGEYEKAINDFTEVIRLDPNVLAYNNRQYAYFVKGDFEKAVQDNTEVIRLTPKDGKSTAYYNRGITWSRLGEYDKSIQDFTEAIRLDPKDAGCLRMLAWLLATCPDPKYRDGNHAVELATRACDLFHWSWNFVNTLAAACAEAGDFENAVRWQTKCIEELPDFSYLKNYVSPLPIYESCLALYKEGKPYHESSPIG